MIESLVQILSPKRRIDILRDAMMAKKNDKPYVMAFCGVNGVGKSTNLAKVFIINHLFSTTKYIIKYVYYCLFLNTILIYIIFLIFTDLFLVD